MLVAVGGSLAGEAWPLGQESVAIGRAPTCDIRLTGDLASRRHCTLAVVDNAVCLAGEGARNPVLVNGKPLRSGSLRVGDSLSIGSDQFLVARRTAWQQSPRGLDRGGDTLSLGDLLSPGGPNTPAELAPGVRISTAEQLAFLFDTTSLLAQCTSREEALALLSGQLKDRLAPDAMWLARTRLPAGALYFRAMPGFETTQASPPSSKIVKLVLKENSGTCTGRVNGRPGQETITSAIICPLAIGAASHGAIVLQRTGESSAYTDSDATFLESLARVVTPVLQAVGVIGELRRDNDRLKRQVGEAKHLLGDSAAMRRLRESLEQAARSSMNVLLQGETGTGKELAARALHEASPRAQGPFVVVNCAAIPEELFESQVFGYRKGAFTGAFESFEGLLAQADGGTLFLDEIADLSLANQARILRAAENGAYRPVGGAEELVVDACMLAATNKNLLALIQEKSFREDLYHRLSGFEIICPPLREHPEDIPALAQHFLGEAREQMHVTIEGIAPGALTELSRWPWRGNVRELRACIFRAAATASGTELELTDFRSSQLSVLAEPPEGLDLESWESRHISQVLEKCGGNVRTAAALLGIGRSTLYKKLTYFNIPH